MQFDSYYTLFKETKQLKNIHNTRWNKSNIKIGQIKNKNMRGKKRQNNAVFSCSFSRGEQRLTSYQTHVSSLFMGYVANYISQLLLK